MRTKLLKLAFAVILSSAALIANAAPTYTFSILESEPDWGTPNLSSYTLLSRPAGPNSIATATDINDSGALAGYISSNSGHDTFAALWSNSDAQYTQLQSLGGAAKQGLAFAISNSGHIVGYSQNASDVYQATLWSPTSYSPTHLQSFFGGNKAGEAWGINNSGQIVGISFDTVSTNYHLLPDANSRATLWDGTNIINLNTYLDTSNNPDGWVLNGAYRIDNDGSIFGSAFKQGIGDKFFSLQSVAAVPEADTSAMLLMGAGVMGFIARRRKNTQA
jgi:probable HAF family extracellular repeat protein